MSFRISNQALSCVGKSASIANKPDSSDTHTYARIQRRMFIKIDGYTKPLLSAALKIQLAAFNMSTG